jgi:fumarate reductase subunit D
MMKPHAARDRGHPGFRAFVVHRVSGLLLAVFLPLHFLALGQALSGPRALDAFLVWTHAPWVKASEIVVVCLLAAHLTGGLRLLLIEFVGWRSDVQKALFAGVAGVSLTCALLFALNLG